MPKHLNQIKFETGILLVLSPTDCIKDRLANFFYYKDRQCLQQAVLVAKNQDIDLDDIIKWSENEGMLIGFKVFESQL